ncbi:ABC transporter substrate-binding protein [Nocardioides sp. zg-578]|uniref:ABC transporter substrate-binding protein n=2 Tax=Nocardioides marmotae TaxID=2663857 RepID=A0A6I3JC79_9ACTN|nr:ABC transporter substrate-binding protein [Nocardioides marmotae]MCR6032017.1 ABC transporter substrate-binding protein [Gordonia jinghuaiqii]MTB83161.1 ABC transporter substrate-binding protein [Nocardioides marmotae]MTB95659.1 ABC transporter substrate-binding protein [Nocardioides marmotae]QKE03441.1 ABC transporter substrate-binding protein [Nocardioides marmotae]
MAGTAVLSLTLAACGSEDDSEPAAEDTPTASTSESSDAVAEEFTNDKCGNGTTSADTYKVGGILPLTGNLAYLGPPEIAGVGLAVSDINAAGGVAGADACHQILDSGDTTDLAVSTSSAGNLVNAKPSIVVGAASSSVTLNVVDTFTDAKIVQVSPANTAVDLSGYSDFFFRTAPPDGIQGAALGTLISSDGYSRIGFLVFSDTYGTGLRNAVQETVEASGGECTYGCKGDGNEFPAGQTTFSSDVSAVLATNPDAIVILAFDETKAIVPELVSQGWDMSKTYLTDGNTADYSKDFDEGTMEGAQGTIPGADASTDFKDRLQGWNQQVNGEELTDYAYAAESYDATILGALAAIKGGGSDPVTIQKNYAAVSGATDGEECTTFADCAALLEEGSEITYTGPSGIGPIDDENDPSSAFVGIYAYDAANKNIFSSTVEGNK